MVIVHHHLLFLQQHQLKMMLNTIKTDRRFLFVCIEITLNRMCAYLYFKKKERKTNGENYYLYVLIL
jgi:hypothetical protein